MNMTIATSRFALLIVALAVAGCDNSPTAPPLFTTQTFTGTVGRQARSSHTFATVQSSATIIRITSFNPATVTMGLGLGTPIPSPTGDACSVSGQAAVVQGDTFQLSLEPASYCVVIFDIGNVGESNTVSYSLTVQHR